jgi:hypothetical protein
VLVPVDGRSEMEEVWNEDRGQHRDDAISDCGSIGLTRVTVMVVSGRGQVREIEVEIGSDIDVILSVFASERGCSIEELILLREGDQHGKDHPVFPHTPIGHDYPHHRRHHVHYIKNVNVKVHYQTGAKHQDFARHEKLEAVLDWAIGVFPIDPTMAGEFELARQGVKEELTLTEHVGHLAGLHDTLELDLVRGDIANGASR